MALFFSTCEKDEDVPISTAKVDITEQTASYRNVQQKGFFVSNATITSAELHYASDSTFSNYQTLVLSVGKDKSYTASIAPLQAGATYYVRYKVANSYSSMLLPCIDTLRTLAYTLPEVATDSVGSITVSSFVGYGTLLDWGCDSLSEFGFCYGDSANPTIEGKHITCTEKDNHFSAEITGLDDGATYYMRAYAVNIIGVEYGKDIEFCTPHIMVKSTVVTSEVTNIAVTSAVCGGKIMSDGYSEIIECGICYSTSTEPTIDDKKVICKQDDNGEFSAELAGLDEGTAYHVRAYAVNAKGVAYGEVIKFSTLSRTKPTVVTSDVTDITTSSAVCGGKIMSDGYSEITECGICYSTSTNPTIEDKKISYNGKDSVFSCKITELQDGTLYYVRAYATNAKGTAYGEERNFTTVAITLPTVVTLEISDILRESAVCSGKITNDGNSEILDYGVCYSISTNPTVNDNVAVVIGNSANFTCTLSGLSAGTTYYVRAYATNVKGIAYGEVRTFMTDVNLPTVVTFEPSDITILSAVCGGQVTSSDAEILACGICYSTSTNPTISDNIVTATHTNNSSNFTCTLSGLNAGTTYYVRAYGTNIKGTAYGEMMMFKTTDSWVDLGLPSGLKWATCNVGATRPEEYGNYYAWGEVTTKTTYDWSTYKYANGSDSTLTKYCNDASYGNEGFTDDLTTLEAADDAATQNWGGKWRMPTVEEWQELKDNCTWTWTTLNGVNGYEVKATNGNFIFLPAAGYRYDKRQTSSFCGIYWSSSLYVIHIFGSPNEARNVTFFSDKIYVLQDYRRIGCSIRPVRR